MKILIISVPSIGHARSMGAVAHALRRRGHDVHWASGAVLRYVERAGAHLHTVLPDALTEDELALPSISAADVNRHMLEEWFTPLAECALAPTLAVARELAPDLIVTDATALWGPAVAEILGKPWATYCPGMVLQSRSRQYLIREVDERQRPVNWARPAIGDFIPWREERRLNALRRQFGLAPADVLNHLSPSLLLSFTSRRFEYGGAGLPPQTRCVGTTFGTDDVDPFENRPAAWPAGPHPLVYVTLGNVFAGRSDLMEAMLRGLEDLPVRVLAAHREAPVSQREVLRQAALVVCHGGYNTVQESLSHGVPVVAVPLGADQGMVARRLAELKLGLCVDEEHRDPASIRAAAELALSDPDLRNGAAAFRLEARLGNGANRAARLLEELAATGTVSASRQQTILDALPETPRFAARFRMQPEEGALAFSSYLERHVFRETDNVQALYWLSGALGQGASLPQLLADWEGEADMVEVLSSLTDKGIVEEDLGSMRLPAETEHRYREQITLFSHVHAGGPAPHPAVRGSEYQERLCNARVVVVGAGVLGSNVARNLAAVGVGALTILDDGVVDSSLPSQGAFFRDTDVGRRRTAALAEELIRARADLSVHCGSTAAVLDRDPAIVRDASLVVLALDQYDPLVYAEIDALCHAAELQWTSVRRSAWNVEIGPTIIPFQTGCFLCFEKRYAAAQQARGGDPALTMAAGSGWFHLAIGSELVALEALRLLSGFGQAASVGQLLILNPMSMTLSRHRLLRLPYCGRCDAARDQPPESAWRFASGHETQR